MARKVKARVAAAAIAGVLEHEHRHPPERPLEAGPPVSAATVARSISTSGPLGNCSRRAAREPALVDDLRGAVHGDEADRLARVKTGVEPHQQAGERVADEYVGTRNARGGAQRLQPVHRGHASRRPCEAASSEASVFRWVANTLASMRKAGLSRYPVVCRSRLLSGKRASP